jgi:hypothetical protein
MIVAQVPSSEQLQGNILCIQMSYLVRPPAQTTAQKWGADPSPTRNRD